MQDYLAIKEKPAIKKLLLKNLDDISDEIFFSDFMYRINSKEEREFRVVMITGNSN